MTAFAPGSIGPLPEDWPEFGTLDGEPVRLADVERSVPWHRRAEVVVELPEGRRRPWRNVPLLAFDELGRPAGPF